MPPWYLPMILYVVMVYSYHIRLRLAQRLEQRQDELISCSTTILHYISDRSKGFRRCRLPPRRTCCP